MANPPTRLQQDPQRARARRTVIVLALVAATIYVAFILHSVLHW